MRETLQAGFGCEVNDLDVVAHLAGLGHHVCPGRRWDAGGAGGVAMVVAVVAVVNVFAIETLASPFGAVAIKGDWTAFVGPVPAGYGESQVFRHVARYGARMSERDARHFFTCTVLEYRP